ncbi:hypothetical protein GLV94_18535 [Virgibacillus halodenitrificans]|uniref:hypothetical protein n=1 Tax=Virgibacillus halodenitrificans TaxID=1482 RepID=UPI001367C663|nr:hypothetical protein [Virgibacillus halodenitrificans]MYL47641.1 hypothetical protein [Virgibacillus halodenitrificans]
MDIRFSDNPDSTGFFINQSTKVRVHTFTDEGVEVTTKSQDSRLGFIPYLNLTTERNQLTKGDSLYVVYLGSNSKNLYFAEEDFDLEPLLTAQTNNEKH